MKFKAIGTYGLVALICYGLVNGLLTRGQEGDSPGGFGSSAPYDHLHILKRNLKTEDFLRKELLERLAPCKVSNLDKAKLAAEEYKRKVLGGMGALEGSEVTSLLQLAKTVPGFAKEGDFIWVVRFSRGISRDVFDELWISSTTGEVRSIFPPSK